MDRKAAAQETLHIMEEGYYEAGGRRIEIKELLERSRKESFLLTPEEGEELLAGWEETRTGGGELENGGADNLNTGRGCAGKLTIRTENYSTVDAVLKLTAEGKQKIGVLNFASAKNPGGGFLNGAMAQEESLAVSGGLYKTLTVHEKYYQRNRSCGTMMYTDHAIYSPEVVFFRDGRFGLLEQPVTASVLTLPAVNMGQVMIRGEDTGRAEQVMRRRMKLALAVFAKEECRHLILGAYGCGVFRNDPKKIARWWKELLAEGFGDVFESVEFAVLDRSSSQECIRAFQEAFPVLDGGTGT